MSAAVIHCLPHHHTTSPSLGRAPHPCLSSVIVGPLLDSQINQDLLDASARCTLALQKEAECNAARSLDQALSLCDPGTVWPCTLSYWSISELKSPLTFLQLHNQLHLLTPLLHTHTHCFAIATFDFSLSPHSTQFHLSQKRALCLCLTPWCLPLDEFIKG